MFICTAIILTKQHIFIQSCYCLFPHGFSPACGAVQTEGREGTAAEERKGLQGAALFGGSPSKNIKIAISFKKTLHSTSNSPFYNGFIVTL